MYAWRRGRASVYRTLVSELMLQQTQAVRVEPVFVAFVRRFPTIAALAAADGADVLRAWAGLGYNRRAILLHRAARIVRDEHAGRVPRDPAVLRTLPGVGPYTAAAVASIAGRAPVAAIDVNVRRIVGRVSGVADDGEIDALAGAWLDRDNPAAWNQALMDLGREHCRAIPRCAGCPLARWCAWCSSDGAASELSRARPQPRFEGSMRQVRGTVVATLRETGSAGRRRLASATGAPTDRLDAALAALIRDGVVERRGRSYRLPRD
jgi:A/G-specific adenine glycosylase